MSGYEQFLKTSLQKYKNPDITKRDVLSVFTSFNDLRPKLDQYMFNDGSRKQLLQLDGTIPVNFKDAVYNIPICIWLMDTHPYNPPMVYVNPIPTMQIKSGQYVDMNGAVDMPYLREWKYPNSDLLGMIQILTIVFGEEPPVYSRVKHQQPHSEYPNGSQHPPAGADCSRDQARKQHTDLNVEAVDQQKTEIQELTALVKEMNERIKKLEKQQQPQQQQQ